MKTFFKFLALVVIHNVARYVIGGAIEQPLIMEQMHAVMPQYPEVFDNDFSSTDFALSFFYNFMMWLTAAWVFHIMHPLLKGNYYVKSFKSYGLMCLFFISLAAIYMNHYTEAIRTFYMYSMLDAVIVFSVVAATNGLVYPMFFKPKE